MGKELKLEFWLLYNNEPYEIWVCGLKQFFFISKLKINEQNFSLGNSNLSKLAFLNESGI